MALNRKVKGILLVLSLLFFLGVAGAAFTSVLAGGDSPQSEIGRYQLSAWASFSGGRVYHSGYYILDSSTGKVVDKGHEVHDIEGDMPPK